MKEHSYLFGRHYQGERLVYDHFVKSPYSDPERGVIRLRGGGTLIAYDLSGPPFESTSAADVTATCAQLGTAFRHLGTGDVLHLIMLRRKAPAYPSRYFVSKGASLIDHERCERFEAGNYYQQEAQLWLGNQDEYPLANYLKGAFFASIEHELRGGREQQMQRFLHRADKAEDALSALHPRRKPPLGMYRSLLWMINGTDYPAPLPPSGAPLYQYLAQQDFIGGSQPRIGPLHLGLVSLVHPWPTHTLEQTMSLAIAYQGTMMVSCRFICLDQTDAMAALELERKHRVREATGTGVRQWLASAFNLPRRVSANEDIEAQIAEIDHVRALVAQGMALGWATLTVELRGENQAEVHSGLRQVVKDLNDLGQGARIEDANAVAAREGALPGNGFDNVRRPLTPGPNFAEQALPVGYWRGTPTIDSPFVAKDTPVPLIYGGSGSEPFYQPSHIRGVGHQLVIGPTGSGKSVLLAVLIAALMVLRNVRIFLLDRGYSSYVLTHALGGTYVELATDQSSPLCPFQWIERDDGITWLFDWFSRLFARWIGQMIDAREAADLTEALTIAKAAGVRTMTAFRYLLHAPRLREIMGNYSDGGQWAHIFDGEPVAGQRHMLTTYELRHLDALGERASAPAVELVVHDAEAGLGPDPTVVMIDEAKPLVASPISLPFIDRALRTFRRSNGALILCTQSLAEIDNSEARALLLESTAIKTFLPNHAAQGEQVRQLYTELGLNEKQIELIAKGVPQRDYLCVTELGSRLFRLDLGPLACALCGSTGSDDVARARRVLEKVGLDGFLDAWLAAKGRGTAPEPGSAPDSTRTTVMIHSNGRVEHADY